MTKYLSFSKRLHYVTFCCFFFPFFYTGCGPTAEEKAAMEKAKQDSIASVTTNMDKLHTEKNDTLNQNNISQADTLNIQPVISQPDTSITKVEKESKTPSEKISNKFEFLRPFLVPKDQTYTGIATIIDTTPFVIFSATFISFLLLIISLVAKYMDPNARKTIAFIDILALISLLVSRPYSWDSEKLWGYGVAATFVFALTIYDLYIIKQSKQTIEM